MRREEMELLSQPYTQPKDAGRDRRFGSSIGADIPSANGLVTEIFSDLDTDSFGISWWTSLPVQERILISDYLYQCADGIETNLAEAKLHYWEILDAREKENKRTIDMLQWDQHGNVRPNMPPSKAPIDDLYKHLEGLHICGFFRAIGSSLDCLGGAILGVLALPFSLRWNDLDKAQKTLKKITAPQNPGEELQVEFRDFFQEVKTSSGPEDWLEWATQYRNMYIHRGRRSTFNNIIGNDAGRLDADGYLIPRVITTLHLAKYPDKSDAEAMVLGDVTLNEDANVTLKGLFKSCRDLEEIICERLISIWVKRRSNPSLLEQPLSQWSKESKSCTFDGYEPDTPELRYDMRVSHPILHRRALAASVLTDAHRRLWDKSKWNE